jgi:hypothetical protein
LDFLSVAACVAGVAAGRASSGGFERYSVRRRELHDDTRDDTREARGDSGGLANREPRVLPGDGDSPAARANICGAGRGTNTVADDRQPGHRAAFMGGAGSARAHSALQQRPRIRSRGCGGECAECVLEAGPGGGDLHCGGPPRMAGDGRSGADLRKAGGNRCGSWMRRCRCRRCGLWSSGWP